MNEIHQAKNYLLRGAQSDCFGEEHVTLMKGKTIEKSSSIYQLTHYLDD